MMVEAHKVRYDTDTHKDRYTEIKCVCLYCMEPGHMIVEAHKVRDLCLGVLVSVSES